MSLGGWDWSSMGCVPVLLCKWLAADNYNHLQVGRTRVTAATRAFEGTPATGASSDGTATTGSSGATGASGGM